ncbi:MAG: hypothetical protein IJ195_02380 [Lachnospiraceae bacterium]|nr:hypothetical protein [Lachnospiraceae bacterium]
MIDLFSYGYNYKDDYPMPREEYENILHMANKYLNHVLYQTLLYLEDQLSESDNQEETFKWVFPVFFVNRFGKEWIIHRINSIKDVIRSRIFIPLDKPVDQFILYYVIDNFVEDFREPFRKLNRNIDEALIEFYYTYCTKDKTIKEWGLSRKVCKFIPPTLSAA